MHHGISHIPTPGSNPSENTPSEQNHPHEHAPASNMWWWSLETCSNLLISGPTQPPGETRKGGNWNWNTYGFKAGSMHPTGMLSNFD